MYSAPKQKPLGADYVIKNNDINIKVLTMEAELINITKKYGKKVILKDISLLAQQGDCIGILGGNGCGKSTLLSILAGVQRCSSGRFICNGNDLFKNNKLRSDLIGYVPQGTPLLEELNARDNLLLWYTKEAMERELSTGVLKMLGIPDFLKTTVSKMSGGMKKQLAIGCAVSRKPRILLLDEPSSALDLVCKENIAEYIEGFKANGGIVLIATHDIQELNLCTKLFIMKNGVLQQFEYDGNVRRLARSLQK